MFSQSVSQLVSQTLISAAKVSELSSFISARFKSIVTVQLTVRNAGQIEPENFKPNTVVKVNAQKEQEC